MVELIHCGVLRWRIILKKQVRIWKENRQHGTQAPLIRRSQTKNIWEMPCRTKTDKKYRKHRFNLL